MNSTVYKVDGSPYSPLLLCKVSKTRALQGEADKKQPGLNRKNVGWGGREKRNSTLERCFGRVGDGSAVKSTDYSSRGPGFDSQHPHSSSLLSQRI